MPQWSSISIYKNVPSLLLIFAYIILLSYLNGDHALSKDTDVALWQDYRAYHGMQPFTDAVDFVIEDFKLHDEFDKLKKDHIEHGSNYLKVNEFLQFFSDHHQQLTDSIITQYNHTYLNACGDDADKLCRWIYDLRDCFNQEALRVSAQVTIIICSIIIIVLPLACYLLIIIFSSMLAKKPWKEAIMTSIAEEENRLTDLHISAANDIMKTQFQDVVGFQPSILGENLSFKRIEGPYLQIIHTNGNHWITVAGIHGSLVKVNDSKYKSISESTKIQITCLTAAGKNYINILLEKHNFRRALQHVDCIPLLLQQKYALELTLPAAGLFLVLTVQI